MTLTGWLATWDGFCTFVTTIIVVFVIVYAVFVKQDLPKQIDKKLVVCKVCGQKLHSYIPSSAKRDENPLTVGFDTYIVPTFIEVHLLRHGPSDKKTIDLLDFQDWYPEKKVKVT